MLFDTHLHLIYPDRLSYPWLADVAALNRPSTFDSYMKKARRLGITDCLHMEVDIEEGQIRAETAMVQEMMALPHSPMRGAISACRPEQSDFADLLDWAQGVPAIKGFRRVLHVVPDEVSTSDMFRDNIKRLGGTGLTYDICLAARQLPLALQLVDHCPDVTFILDHCGVPDINDGAMSPWDQHMSALGERPNVMAKISGIVAYANPDTWGLDDLRPWFDHTVSAFGHDRIIWGSDSPVCDLGGGLETWVAASHALTQGWGDQDRAALYRRNALNIWNF